MRSLPGVGPATGRRLEKLGIATIAELRARPLEELEGHFGRWGKMLFNYSRGVDERPVRLHRERKSLSSERTYSRDLAHLAEMDAELEKLAERVAAGLRKRELSACTITVKVRYGDFTTVTRSHTLPAPSAEARLLAEQAKGLLRKSEAAKRPVRLLGLGASNLVRGRVEQLSLFLAES